MRNIHLLTAKYRNAKFPTRQVVHSSDQFNTFPCATRCGFQGQGLRRSSRSILITGFLRLVIASRR